ncbi:hypothetical protein M422DRAFT_230313 [Sphaerobolus stellatus SS14]|uniref:Protochlorophyllide reductase n=1 Tax=Sphaerobolus stellatus (strain SS14) TaxID=990650 RepID=A0A0C9UAH5_SPHS4|nr:hypothetical protein M422DRAFT_230313 [Sphaerobolus stellatus SS14]
MLGSLIAKIAPHSQPSQFLPPASTFAPERDIPDLKGKVVIVTGGNSGVGYETVKQLLLKDAKVYLAGRNPQKCKAAVKRLKEETKGKEPVFLRLDLADLKSVRKAAEEFMSKEERLDVLFNNAGVMMPRNEMLTAQGYDIQFGTNVLGHYFFTILLMPALEKSTKHYGVKARIVNTSSIANHAAPGPTGINWRTLKGGEERDKVLNSTWLPFKSELMLYGASKIGSIFLSNILVRYYGDIVASCSLNPGGIRTELYQHLSYLNRLSVTLFLYPPTLGALTQLWAGTTATLDEMNGNYFQPWARPGTPDPRAANEQTQDELKVWLEEQVKGF